MDDFKKYIQTYYPTIAEGCRDLAKQVNRGQPRRIVTAEHIRHAAYGKCQLSIKLCNKLMQVAPGRLTYKELRPDVYKEIMDILAKERGQNGLSE